MESKKTASRRTARPYQAFHVILEDNGKVVPYDIMKYLTQVYARKKRKKDAPKTVDEFTEFIKTESRYMWWSRCQYEIIISDWPKGTVSEKWDVHQQVMMNLPLVVRVLMENVGADA